MTVLFAETRLIWTLIRQDEEKSDRGGMLDGSDGAFSNDDKEIGKSRLSCPVGM